MAGSAGSKRKKGTWRTVPVPVVQSVLVQVESTVPGTVATVDRTLMLDPC
jgi:hypothetical protein